MNSLSSNLPDEDKRKVIINGELRPFNTLKKGDIFYLEDSDCAPEKGPYKAICDLYTNDQGILTVKAEDAIPNE